MHGVDKFVYAMASVRFVSSLLELTGAILMLRLGTAERALQVNSLLALTGPIVLVTVTMLGIAGLSDSISWWRIIVILVGVACILLGAKG